MTSKEAHTRSSVHVAPLQIYRAPGGNDRSRAGSREGSGCQAQMTPPATPNGSQETLVEEMESSPPVFHAFLRAFYPFHPSCTDSDATVTLPLNEGDVILVHSIHTNGWADGTLLISGARGWLPTNYCEAYEPDSMRSLLHALLNFWDLLRSGFIPDIEVFGNQEFMRGIIAGVRYLLERSNCLTRESPTIQGNDLLRRSRKALLSELSSLVKTAKRLQEFVSSSSMQDSEDTNDLLDEMVLKAFKIVTRAVRFIDVLEDDKRTSQLINVAISTVTEDADVPPTPPGDSTSFEHAVPAPDVGFRRASNQSSVTDMSEEHTKRKSLKRMSCLYSGGQNSARPISVQPNRLSVSHRLSTAGSLLSGQRSNLISERLSSSHDELLSFLGSLIGRLHLQSQSSADLLLAIKQSIAAGRSLLILVGAVCAHNSQSEESLVLAKDTMCHCINQLILAARECVRPSCPDEDSVIMPQENARLKEAATGCVVAAGECVAKIKFVIERIGDFELNPPDQESGPGPDPSTLATSPNIVEVPAMSSEVAPSDLSNRPLPPPLVIPSNDKPLPMVPEVSSSHALGVPPQSSGDVTVYVPNDVPKQSSTISLLPPLPKLTSPLLPQDEYTLPEQSSGPDGDFQTSFRSGSVAVSTSGTNSTYISCIRDSESSMVSQTSTRATTPDVSPYAQSYQSSFSNLSNAESQITLAEDADDAESKMLEKTYAHELLYNKEGQITGGTLPALVERLTTHDSTPDAMFVSTFYLTFRLFVSPVELAEALVDRFDYVAESPHIAGPVRLRVYNVFKGWLESHWRDLSDHDALTIIEPFAQEKLSSVLPAAGKRLLELARKVSSIDGALVPRLVSSMGKTSTSISQYVPPDAPLPTPSMSKSQTNALKNWKMGGSFPSILEFDPLELARQFTIKEMNIFCSILPEELLASEWMKKSGSNAINVRAMSTLSTDMSNLVADTILQHEDAKKRAVVIKHWIKIAQKCLELNNYDSLMAIICSLNSSTITRLRKTWDIVSQKRKDILKTLQDIVEPTKNHAVLRQRLHDHVPPCLPFVGTYLTDLTFVDIGNPAHKRLPGIGGKDGLSVINFDKHARTAKIIGELQRFQIPYRLTEVPELQEWIQAQIVRVRCSSDQNNVQQYYRKSLLLEPRANCPRTSPADSLNNTPLGTKDKFDLFSWTHSKEKSITTRPTTPIAA